MAIWEAQINRQGSTQYRLTWKANGDDFQKVLAIVKAIPGRSFDPAAKAWSIPASSDLSRLHALGFKAQFQEESTATEDAPKPPMVHPYEHEWGQVEFDTRQFPDLFDKQLGDLQFFQWAGGCGLLIGEVGYGKRLAFGTPVLTLEGYKPIESLTPGVDKGLGIDGKPCNILEKWINYDRPLFRLKFSDGTEIEADDEHLWTFLTDPVNEMTATTLEMFKYYEMMSSRYLIKLRMPKVVGHLEFPWELRGLFRRAKTRVGCNSKYAIRIESITRIPNGPGCCISVDSPDHLYLIKNCIPTHNTVSGLSWLKLRPDLRPALIITRAGIKRQWQRQWRRWVGADLPEVLEGETPRDLSPNRSYVINREILHRWEAELMALRPQCVIVDECQDFGNAKAKKTVKGVDEDGNEVSRSINTPVLRTQSMRNIARQAPSRIFLSATPFNTRIQQFYTVLNLLMPDRFPKEWPFLMRYCDPKPGKFGGWDFTGASNLQELHAIASRVMLFRDRDRKNKTSMYSVVLDTEMGDKERKAQIEAISVWNAAGDLESALTRLESMSGVEYKYKSKAVIQWLKSVVDSGESILVFGRHRAVLESIAAAMGKKGALYYGDTSKTARERIIADFVAGKVKVLAANVEAAGVGLDGLQHGCHKVAFAEVPTSPSAAKQCIGRVDRTGQEKDVDAIYLVGEGTSDELALSILKARWGILDAVRNGTPWDDKQAIEMGRQKWRAEKLRKEN